MSYASATIHGHLGAEYIIVASSQPGTLGNGLTVKLTHGAGPGVTVRATSTEIDIDIGVSGQPYATNYIASVINANSGGWWNTAGNTLGLDWTNDDADETLTTSGGVDENVGHAAGTSTVAATGIAKKPAVGASAGTSTAAGVGKANTAGVGTAAGTTAVAASSNNAASKGTGAGTSTATGVGSASIGSAGSAQGGATVTGVTGLRQAVGLAQGTSAVVYNDPQPILAPVTSRVDHVQRAIDRLCQYAKEKRSVQ